MSKLPAWSTGTLGRKLIAVMTALLTTMTVVGVVSTPVEAQSLSGGGVLVSAKVNWSGGGVSFADEDIAEWDPVSGVWSLVFDGSSVGLTGSNHDIDAFHVGDDGSVVFSIQGAASVGSLGTVDDSDLVLYDAASGGLSLLLDGSTISLSTDGEDIDGVSVLADGSILFSTFGTFWGGGGKRWGDDEDVFRYDPVSGEVSLWFDASDVGYTADMTGVSVEGDSLAFVSAKSSDKGDVLGCELVSVGESSDCSLGVLFEDSTLGTTGLVLDGVQTRSAGGPPPGNTAPVLSSPGDQSGEVGESVVLDLVASDADDDDLVFSSTALPGGLSLDGASGRVSGTLDEVFDQSVTFTVSDGTATDSVTVSWLVTDGVEPPPLSGGGVLVSAKVNWSGGGVSFADEDIAEWDPVSGVWSLVFDGSSVGLTGSNHDIDAFHVGDDGSVVFSIQGAASVGSLGTVDDSDLVLYDAASGGLSLLLDGSTISLSTDGEDIDGVSVLADGSILFSTFGTFWGGGGKRWGDDEDVFRYDPVSGEVSLWFDASDVGYTADMTGVSVEGDSLAFVSAKSSDKGDVLGCELVSVGESSDCSLGVLFEDSTLGTTGLVLDGVQTRSAGGPPPGNTAPVLSSPGDQSGEVGESVVLDLVASDADDDDLVFSSTALPGGLSLDGASGRVSGTLDEVFDQSVTFTVSDGTATDSVTVSWLVTDGVEPPPLSGGGVLVSAKVNWSGGGVSFADEDIAEWDPVSGVWSLVFDGSSVGLTGSNHDIDAFHVGDDGSVVFSIQGAASVGSLGTVDDSDLVLYDAASGGLSLLLDGSTISLSTDGEDIDGVSVLADGSILFSTFGTFWGGGGKRWGDDEDVFRYDPVSGEVSLWFDASDVGYTADMTGVSVEGDSLAFVSAKSSDKGDVLGCELVSVGESSDCSLGVLFEDSTLGTTGLVLDGVQTRSATPDFPDTPGVVVEGELLVGFMVVGDSGGNVEEQAIAADNDDVTVTIVEDDDLAQTDLSGAHVVLLSDTANQGLVGDRLREISIPVIAFGDAAVTLGLATAVNTGSTELTWDVGSAAHPLLDQFHMVESAEVLNEGSLLTFDGVPAASIVARSDGSAVLLDYPAGSTLADGTTAQGPRSAFFVRLDQGAQLAETGQLLVVEFMTWASGFDASSSAPLIPADTTDVVEASQVVVVDPEEPVVDSSVTTAVGRTISIGGSADTEAVLGTVTAIETVPDGQKLTLDPDVEWTDAFVSGSFMAEGAAPEEGFASLDELDAVAGGQVVGVEGDVDGEGVVNGDSGSFGILADPTVKTKCDPSSFKTSLDWRDRSVVVDGGIRKWWGWPISVPTEGFITLNSQLRADLRIEVGAAVSCSVSTNIPLGAIPLPSPVPVSVSLSAPFSASLNASAGRPVTIPISFSARPGFTVVAGIGRFPSFDATTGNPRIDLYASQIDFGELNPSATLRLSAGLRVTATAGAKIGPINASLNASVTASAYAQARAQVASPQWTITSGFKVDIGASAEFFSLRKGWNANIFDISRSVSGDFTSFLPPEPDYPTPNPPPSPGPGLPDHPNPPVDPGNPAPPGPGSGTPPSSVTVSAGGSAKGRPGCSTDPCRFVVVEMTGGSGYRNVNCYGDGQFFYSYSTARATTAVCYYGYPGRDVHVTVDGVRSNTIVWGSAPAPTPPPSGGTISLTRGAAGPASGSYWYNVTLSGFAANAPVSVTCRDEVEPGGFWTQTLTTNGSGAAGDSTLCYSSRVGEHWVTAGSVSSARVRWNDPVQPPPSASVQLVEGASAQGQPNCSSSACRFLNISFSGLGTGTHTVTCNSDRFGEYYRTTTANDSSFNGCYYGFPGDTVWATVDGVRSNNVTWGGGTPPPPPPPPPSASVQLVEGASAQGQPNCSSSACRFLNITYSGLGTGNHTVTCNSSRFGEYIRLTTSNDSSFNGCYYGYTGDTVWATVDGVRSNDVVWGTPPPPPPPPPDASVSLAVGGSAQGQPGCSSSACRYLNISFSGLGTGTHAITCNSSRFGVFWSGSTGNDSSFNGCYYGFPGDTVWATVDGVRSNNVTWPSAPPPPPPPPPPDPSVSLAVGGSAQGQPGCSSSACRYLNISFSGLGTGTHAITCNSSRFGVFWSGSTGNDSSFNGCYYGFPGDTVWATVDGVRSNNVIWP